MAEVVTNLREPAPSSPPGGRPGAGLAISLALRLLSVGPLLILIVLIAGISLLTPNFLKPVNISNILAQTAVIAIVAIGQHLVILTRGIDLSVGSNLALATVVGGLVFRAVDSAPFVMMAMLAHRRDGRRGQRRRLRLRPPAASLHHHARHPEHLPGPRARIGDRPHDDARHARLRSSRSAARRRLASPIPSSSSSLSPRASS